MKLVIGYDGSACSDAAIDDLRRAGLPPRVEATVVTVGEVPPHTPDSALQPLSPAEATSLPPAVRLSHFLTTQAMAEARRVSDAGAGRVRSLFPQWTVNARAVGDSPTHGLVHTLEAVKPDLLVVGSYGRSAVGRVLLGSVSQGVLTHAACSVRIGRCRADDTRPANAPVKVAVGVDGSVDAAAAVAAVASRAWPPGSTALVLVAVNVPLTIALMGVAAPVAGVAHEPDLGGHARAQRTAEAVERELHDAGLTAVSIVRDGDPKAVVVQEAELWGADCIFVGAKGHGRVEKLLLGSVSAAVAARAHCSVEVVRQD